MEIEDSCAVLPIMEIDGQPLCLRDANAIWMFVILGKPSCSCRDAMCVCVCVRVRACLSSRDCGLGARARPGAIAPPFP